jgi:hypothetical protein
MAVRLGPGPKLTAKIEKPEEYRVIALSPWRGGTRFLATWLCIQGLQVEHESPLKGDGGVAPRIWRHADADIWVHLVRHPLLAIRSMTSIHQSHAGYWARVLGWDTKDKDVIRSPEAMAHVWYLWHHDIDLSLADKHPTLVRLEHWEKEFPLILRHLGGNGEIVPIDKKILENSRTTKKRFASLSWRDLGVMEEPVRRLAATYGYKE